MAKEELLRNLTTARNLLVHGVQTDDSGQDAESIKAQLDRAAIWLTPSSVKGFDVRDFSELPPEAQKQLREDVEQFVRIAKQVPSDKPATRGQVEEALPRFLSILRTIDPYLPKGGEFARVREALRQCGLPANVLTWEFELGVDSTGDPAIWLWLFVDDATSAKDTAEMATEVRARVREALSGAGIERWPYLRFRTASEQRAL